MTLHASCKPTTKVGTRRGYILAQNVVDRVVGGGGIPLGWSSSTRPRGWDPSAPYETHDRHTGHSPHPFIHNSDSYGPGYSIIKSGCDFSLDFISNFSNINNIKNQIYYNLRRSFFLKSEQISTVETVNLQTFIRN